MASGISLQPRRISDQQSHKDSSSLLERVEQLVKRYEAGLVSALDISAQVNPLIEELVNLKDTDLSLAREGLCRLLRLDSKAIQKGIIQSLKPLLHLSHLAYDVTSQQSQQLLILEERISIAIAKHAHSSSLEIPLFLLDIYQDVLERLWLLPHLSDDRSSYAIIVETNGPCIIRRAKEWLSALTEKSHNDKRAETVLESTCKILQRIVACPPNIAEEVKRVKPNLSSVFIFALIGKILQRVGDKMRAIYHYKITLKSLSLLRIENLTKSLEKTKCDILSQLGTIYRSLGKYQKALEFQKKQLEIAQNLKDRATEELAYESIGVTYHSLENFHKAIKYYKENLKIARERADREGEELALGNLGNAYAAIKEYPEAIKCFHERLQIARERKNHNGEGSACRNLGDAHRSLNEDSKALEYYKKALQIAQESKDHVWEGRAYENIGSIYESQGDIPEAIEFYRKALELAKDSKDLSGAGQAYKKLGNIYESQGDISKAIECYQKALEVAKDINILEEGIIYERLGAIYNSISEYSKGIENYEQAGAIYNSVRKYDKAIECFTKVLQIAQTLKDPIREIRAYQNLGNTYYSLGEYYNAIEWHKKYLHIVQKSEDVADVGRGHGNLGNAYDSQGEYRLAIEHFMKALQIAKDSKDRSEEGRIYGSLASAYDSLGQYRRAIKYYSDCLKIAKERKDHSRKRVACTNLASVYLAAEEYDKAIEYAEEGLKVAKRLKDRRGKGIAYTSLGIVRIALKEYGVGIEYLRKGLQVAKDLKDRVRKGSIYTNLGIVYQRLKQYGKAAHLHRKHLLIAQNLKHTESMANAHYHLGCIYYALLDFEQSIHHFQQGISILSTLQSELGDNHQGKITIFEEQVDAYLGLERVLLKQNKIREALEVSNARRARALNGALAKRKNLRSDQVDAFMKIDQILKFVTATKSTYLLYSFSSSREEKLQLNVYVITPSGEIYFKTLPFDLIPEDSRDVDKIVFPFGRKKGERASSSTVPILAELEKCLVTKGIPPRVIKGFKDRLKNWYEVLIQPIEQYLPQEKSAPLVIIPDGFLSQLPFSAFLCETEGKSHYLIERFSLSFAPSLSTLTLLNSSLPTLPIQACIVSNPSTPDTNLNLEVSESHVSQLSVLLKAPAEALFTNKKATIEGFKQVATKARLIHISCHGEAGIEKNPDKFSVFEGLLKFAPDDNHKDGYLHAQEIASLPLAADLVFLDACFSGAGKVQREGSIGQIWSFHAAGASSVVGGLWFVPESKLIIDLIDNFYTHYLSQSMSKSNALHLAITKAIEQERENPHLWGPLFLSGAS